MHFSYLSRVEALKLSALFGLVVILGLSQTWVWGQVRERVALFDEAKSRDEQLQLVNERVKQVQASLDSQADLLNQLPAILPPAAQVPLVIDRLERMADERGLTIRVVEIEEGAGSPLPLTLRLEVTGGSEALFAYVHALEHRQEFTRIKSVALVPVTGNTGVVPGVVSRGLYRLSLTVIFYLQQPSSHGKT